MQKPLESAVTACSTCGQPLNASGDCLACLLRGGLAEARSEAKLSSSLVFGDFAVEQHPDGSNWELGRGAMGVTYLAMDKVLRRKVALKVIQVPAAARGSAGVRERFLREARAAAALRHPNVAAVYQFGASHDGAHCYYAMELVEGETLEDFVRRNGFLEAKPALEIAIQISRALTAAALHGLIHRDLKPGNIMLTGSGPPEPEVKVIDFGLARAIADAEGEMNLTRGGFVGTPNFASPEQLGSDPVDARSDIYSLGATVWFALTGLVPRPGSTVEEIRARQAREVLPIEQLAARKVPGPLVKLLRATLAVDPAERPGSARELMAALESCRGKIGRRRPVVYALSAFLVILLGLTIWAKFLRSAPDPWALFREARILASHSSSHLEGRENNPRVITLLEKAVAADPKFAEAHAELAMAYIIRLFLYAPAEKELEQKAYLEVERALSLNPKLASAYLARGRLKWTPFHHFPHADAIGDFKRALALDPNLDEAHHYLGLVLLHIGLLEEARAEFQTAIGLNPSNNGAQFRLGETLFFEGRFREARNVFEKTDPDFNPALREYQLALSLFALGQTEEAQTGLEKYLKSHPQEQSGLLASAQAMIFAAGAQPKEAAEKIQAAQASRGFGHFHHSEYNIACAYALMNQTDPAVEWFERAVNDGFNCYPMFERDPNLDRLRSNLHFQRLMETERIKWENYRIKFGTAPPLPEKSIAVLPLENLSDEKENAYFADGIHEELLSHLAKIRELKVISRTSVLAYKGGTPRSLKEIARQLGVNHVVEGSVRRDGDQVRVSVQLIDARTDTHLWAEQYDRDLADIFVVQTEIAQQIANQLRAELSTAEQSALAERPTADLVAYAIYTKARQIDAYNWEGEEQGVTRKIELLEKATERDPAFGLAYCALAKTYCDFFSITGAGNPGHLESARKAAQDALRVRPGLGEAHLELARYYFYAGLASGDFDRSRDELIIARGKLPNDSEVLLLEARIDKRQNRWESSLANLQRARELDPRNGDVAYHLWRTCFEMRRYREAEQIVTRIAATGPPRDPWIQTMLAEIKLAEGDPVAAQALLEQVPLEFSPVQDVWEARLKAALYRRDYDAVDHIIAAIPRKSADHFLGGPPLENWTDGQIARARRDKRKAASIFSAARERLRGKWPGRTKDNDYFSNLAKLEAGLGRKGDAIRAGLRAAELKAIAEDSYAGLSVATDLALVYAWTGGRDRAFEQLAIIAPIPAGPTYGDLLLNPCWDDLCGDKRFNKIVAAAEAATR